MIYELECPICEECNQGKKDVLLLERNIYKINKKIDSKGVSVDSKGVSNGGKNK